MRYPFFIVAVWLGIVLSFSGFFHCSPAAADTFRTVKVELTDQTNNIDIGSEVYIVQDATRRLNYNTVISRHLNGDRGDRQSGPVLNLGQSGVPVWLLFTVENKSSKEEWLLDFGSMAQGRYAFANRLLVRNHSEGQTVYRALKEKNNLSEGRMSGAVLKARIPKGKTSLFVVYLEPFSGLSGTIRPHLVRVDQAVYTASGFSYFCIAGLVLFVAMAGFFTALSFVGKSAGTLFFSAYYLLNVGLLASIGRVFQPEIALSALMPVIVLAGIVLTALAMTRSFLDLGEDQARERLGLFICAFAVLASSIAVVSIFLGGVFSQSGYPQAAFSLACFCALGFIVLASFAQTSRLGIGAPYYATGWLFVLGGVMAFMLGTVGILEPGPLVMNAYWLSLLPQAACLVCGLLKKIQTREDQEQQAQIRQLREAQTLSKLKQTKESADQSRLLRVIEREREVMAEMREKEMRRTEEMRLAMEHADEANRAKSAFLAVVSHEIRTPMTGIMGMVKLLQGTKLGSEQNDYVLAVQKSGDTMMALLNDILDFEKIESGNMELEHIDFDLHKLVGGVVTLMSGQATEKKIYLKSDIPEDIPKYVRGDPTRLRQVILNLTNNAIKFTETGGVTIHLRATPLNEKIGKIKADYEIYFAVEDTGIGIPEEVQENLFSPFAQAEKSTTRKYGGTGLGLAICKKLIEAMGSSIRVSSEEGSGSTFYFTLLVEEGRAELAEDLGDKKIIASDYQTEPRHILVVEDNEMNRRVFTGLLEKQGHKVVTAPSGEEALKKHEAMDFDLVISDVNMNGMSGMDLTRSIRAMRNKTKASIPVIALTGNVRPEDIKEFYAANMNGFLAKPIDPDKLAMMIKKFSEGELDQAVILQENSAEEFEIKTQPPSQSFDITSDELEVDSFDEVVQDIPTTEPEGGVLVDDDRREAYRAMFDLDLLEQLSGSLGRDQFVGLINDYIEHADRIVNALADARDMKDLKEIKTRAHELKGMAANFGVKAVSKIAANAESAAGKSQLSEAIDALKEIVSLNKDTNAALREWIGSKD